MPQFIFLNLTYEVKGDRMQTDLNQKVVRLKDSALCRKVNGHKRQQIFVEL